MRQYLEQRYSVSYITRQGGVPSCWCMEVSAAKEPAECWRDCEVCLGFGIPPIPLEDLR